MPQLKDLLLNPSDPRPPGLSLSTFFKVFTRALIIYFTFFYWSLDWKVYLAAQGALFSQVPGLGYLFNFPISHHFLNFILVVQLIFGGLWFCRPQKSFFGVLFTLIVLFLDLFHNSFGFVNVQTHGILFLMVVVFLTFSSPRQLKYNQGWGFRFLELIFTMVYFQSAISKLVTSGMDWALDGTTLQIAMLRQLQPLGQVLSQFPTFCVLMSVTCLLIELFFPMLYFFVIKKKYMMSLSVLFHIGTFFLLGIHFFHLWVFPLSYLISIFIKIKYKAFSTKGISTMVPKAES